jgi:hypothetical protein
MVMSVQIIVTPYNLVGGCQHFGGTCCFFKVEEKGVSMWLGCIGGAIWKMVT